MRLFSSEVLIQARAASVWHVITDGGNFGVWESGILEADGAVRAGDTVRITPSGGRRSVKLRVRQVSGNVMTWHRRLPFGLWSRTRTFTLTPQSRQTRLTVVEKHRGLLLPFSKHASADLFLDRFTDAVRRRSEILDRATPETRLMQHR
ncbi:SRPBCC family protein [Arthrobacter sp. NPDC056493]|uniref:SRPBCC family protein n=1 Tax=Arthrobacter sp. NPDC056493 TaxID=3345839 RepID=UPI00366BF40D